MVLRAASYNQRLDEAERVAVRVPSLVFKRFETELKEHVEEEDYIKEHIQTALSDLKVEESELASLKAKFEEETKEVQNYMSSWQRKRKLINTMDAAEDSAERLLADVIKLTKLVSGNLENAWRGLAHVKKRSSFAPAQARADLNKSIARYLGDCRKNGLLLAERIQKERSLFDVAGNNVSGIRKLCEDQQKQLARLSELEAEDSKLLAVVQKDERELEDFLVQVEQKLRAMQLKFAAREREIEKLRRN